MDTSGVDWNEWLNRVGDAGPLFDTRPLTRKHEDMTEITRPEFDARFEAMEARAQARDARIEGKLGQIETRLDAKFDFLSLQLGALREDIAFTRTEARSTKANVWYAAVTVISIGVAAVALFPQFFDFGEKVRESARQEAAKVAEQPPPK